MKIIKEGASHKLVIDNCKKDDAGIYHFEVDGRKSKATLTVQGKNGRLQHAGYIQDPEMHL